MMGNRTLQDLPPTWNQLDSLGPRIAMVRSHKGSVMIKAKIFSASVVPLLLLAGFIHGQKGPPEEARQKSLMDSFRGPELYGPIALPVMGRMRKETDQRRRH